MKNTDATPSPSEVLLARLLAELDQTPPSQRSVVLGRYLQEYPDHAGVIRELVDADAGVRPAPGADPTSRRLKPGQRLGAFRVVRFVAQGGMGEVYEALQDVLNRRVALKVIRNGFVSPTARARFLREQQVLAKLHQTNIVPVHHAGEEGDLQYCAMQFVDGASLHKVVTELYRQETSSPGSRITPPIREVVDSLLRSVPEEPVKAAVTVELSESMPPEPTRTSTPLPPPLTLSPSYFSSAAAVMIQVAEAVQHGHDHNICHRDIKPSNLIIDSAEMCWVIDYGLASAVNTPVECIPLDGETADPILTQGPLGTPQYMAPEQFEGKTDPRSDVWSLGVTLYELLTLRPAFRGDSWAAAKELVARSEPGSPRDLVRNVPADLAAICRKAMAKDPADRYPSAQAFADDLRRWSHWEPTKARPAWATLRPLRLWAWRKKAWAATAAVVLVSLVAGLLVTDAIGRERVAAANALADEKQKQLVELQRAQAISKLQEIRLGEKPVGWWREAMRHLEIANEIRPGDDLVEHATAMLFGLDSTQMYKHSLAWPPRPGQRGVGRVVFSPDSVRVLASGWQEGTDLSPALLWDGNIASKPTESTRPGAGPVAFPDADSPLQLILPAEPQQPLTLWNVELNAKVLDIPVPWHGRIIEAALSTDARFAAVSWVPVKVIGSIPGPVTSLWAIDRKAATPKSNKLANWPGAALTLAFSPDGRLLATGSETGEIVIRSTAEGKPVRRFEEGELPINALAFGRKSRRPSGDRAAPADAADSWLLAVGSKGGGLSVWDLRSPVSSRMNRFFGSEHDVYGVAFSPDGTALASCGRNFAFLWNVATGQRLLRALGNQGEQFRGWTEGVAFSPDGRKVAFGSAARFSVAGLDVYRLDEDRGVRTYRGLLGVVEKVWLSPSGRWVAALAQNWQLGVWDRATGQIQFIWNVPAGITADNSALAFDDNDGTVLFASGERVSKWNLATGELADSWKVPLGLNDCLATRPGQKPLLVRRDRVNGALAIRGRKLEPNGSVQELYTLDLGGASVVDSAMAADGHVLLVNAKEPTDSRRAILFDGLTGHELVRQPANAEDGSLSSTGKTLILDKPVGETGVRSELFQLPELTSLGAHPILDRTVLRRVDDKGKLGLASSSRPPNDGVALFRIGEDRSLLTFDRGRPPTGNGYGISPDGLFIYWGRHDGTVCVADVNKCMVQLAPFRK